MKRTILALAIIFGLSTASVAQTSSKMENKGNHAMQMKDGVMMVDNHAILCSHKKCTPLTKTYNCKDGCKVAPDGTVTKPDGSTMKLMNGYEIAASGKVMMIPHGQKGHVCGPECPMYGKKM